MSRKQRIVIYGGTFDPVHGGHLELARKVLQLFEIDQLIFVPAQRAPHKLERETTPAVHRYAMLALATQQDPQLLITTFEIEAPGRQYTIDTLRHFRSEFPSADLFFLMGADSWSEITTWHEWEELTKIANLIVATRPGCEIDKARASKSVADLMVDLRARKESLETANENAPPKVFLTDAVMNGASATEIRRAARAKDFVRLRELVPPAVADYITKYELYR